MLDKDDGISAGQGKAQTTDRRRKQENINAWIGIKGLYNAVPTITAYCAVQAEVRHLGHERAEQVLLNDIEHVPHLAENQHAVLRHRCAGVGANQRSIIRLCVVTNTTV